MTSVSLVITPIAISKDKPTHGAQPKKSSHGRSASQRISWLQKRLSQHEKACQRHKTKKDLWHCKAKRWTKAELRQAQKEKYDYDWDWQRWLPAKYARVGACETGYGKPPGNWHWDSGTYVSAFGIVRSGYAQFARKIGLPAWDDPGVRTAHQQYLVAKAIHDSFGWGAWGCGGA